MRIFKWLLFIILILLIVLICLWGYLFQQTLPQLDGEIVFKRLSSPVSVTTDDKGIPVIQAQNRYDAARILGYITARDRLFQLDLMRRKNSGRLAEIFGSVAVASDKKMRIYGFERVAKLVARKLPDNHKQLFSAYAEGVNEFIANAKLPFEFTLLRYQPELWRIEDSILVVLGMYDMLTAEAEQDERMLTVMEKKLPDDVVAFLTPDTDHFTELVHGKNSGRRNAQTIPISSLEALLDAKSLSNANTEIVKLSDSVIGSNAWVVSGLKTDDGRAILANDMHVALTVPNLWYRVELKYAKIHVVGLILPGVPAIIAGSNHLIAWGNTSLSGDFLDLVSIELNPNNNQQYRVREHWQDFQFVTETIIVKDADPIVFDVQQSIWGPVSDKTLLKKPVAIHWLALDDKEVNFNFLDMQEATSLVSAMDIANQTAGPPLNIMLADNKGNIAWTLLGKIPKRFGDNGLVSRSWADGSVGWDGFVGETELPRKTNPLEGFLVSANDRVIGKDYPYIIGHQFVNGYRAYRLNQRLKNMQEFNEASMFALQLDTETEFYAFYQQLALSVLTSDKAKQLDEQNDLRDALLAWNGRADKESIGFPILVEFRERLAKAVLNPFLKTCLKSDEHFQYSWQYIDTPLRALLKEMPKKLLPDPVHFSSWNSFILNQLKISAEAVKSRVKAKKLQQLTWGDSNHSHINHVFYRIAPNFLSWLNMPEEGLAGCDYCVRVVKPSFGASERMVVSPSHLEEAIFHMPGGQSAHPFSKNHHDQHGYWAHGLPLDLLAGKAEHLMMFTPTSSDH